MPALRKNSLRHRSLQFKKITKKGASKVLQIKTTHCLLNQHKSKIVQDIQPKCGVSLVNKTLTHYLLQCSKFDTQRTKLMRKMSYVLRKNILCPFNVSTEALMGKHVFNTEDFKPGRVELEKYFLSNKTFSFVNIKVIRKHFYCYICQIIVYNIHHLR